MKNDIDIVLSIPEEKKGQSSVDFGLPLPSWYDPDLCSFLVMIQVSETPSCLLKIVDLHVSFFEDVANRLSINLYKFPLAFEVFVSFSNREKSVSQVILIFDSVMLCISIGLVTPLV